MGRFSKIKEATFNSGGTYFDALPLPLEPGQTEEHRKYAQCRYLARVDVLKTIETRSNDTAFIGEFTVLESEHPAHRPGSTCSYYTDSSNDAFLGNVKHVVSVVTDTDPAEIDEAGVEMVVSEKNPCQGEIVQVTATMILTKKKTLFTKVIFRPATEEQKAKHSPKSEQKTA